MLSHSQEAEFHCPLCERRYKRKWDLSRHIKKVHQSKNEEDLYKFGIWNESSIAIVLPAFWNRTVSKRK